MHIKGPPPHVVCPTFSKGPCSGAMSTVLQPLPNQQGSGREGCCRPAPAAPAARRNTHSGRCLARGPGHSGQSACRLGGPCARSRSDPWPLLSSPVIQITVSSIITVTVSVPVATACTGYKPRAREPKSRRRGMPPPRCYDVKTQT